MTHLSPCHTPQDYKQRQEKHEQLHKFKVSPTSLHLIPKQQSAAARTAVDGGRGRGRDRDRRGKGGRLPAWYALEAHKEGEAPGGALSESFFADYLRRSHPATPFPDTPDATATFTATAGQRRGGGEEGQKGRPQSAGGRGTSLRHKQHQRPHSAFRVGQGWGAEQQQGDCEDGDGGGGDRFRHSKGGMGRDRDRGRGRDGGGEGDGVDWLLYSEKEVRAELLGPPTATASTSARARASVPGTPEAAQTRPLSASSSTHTHQLTQTQTLQTQTEAQTLQTPHLSARHQFLAGLMSDEAAEGGERCRELLQLRCRVRCSLLSELPPQRVQLPPERGHLPLPAASPASSSHLQHPTSHSPGSSSSCAVYSVTLYDLGLVCPAALLSSPSSPSPSSPSPSSSSPPVAVSAGECAAPISFLTPSFSSSACPGMIEIIPYFMFLSSCVCVSVICNL